MKFCVTSFVKKDFRKLTVVISKFTRVILISPTNNVYISDEKGAQEQCWGLMRKKADENQNSQWLYQNSLGLY